MEKKKLGLWVPVLVIAAALLMLAVSTGTVDAAPRAGRGGGKGHGGTTAACSTCVLTVSPNPVPLNSTSITISGSGFGASSFWVNVGSWFGDPYVTPVDGSFSITYSHTFWAPGQYTVRAYMGDTTFATTTFTVE